MWLSGYHDREGRENDETQFPSRLITTFFHEEVNASVSNFYRSLFFSNERINFLADSNAVYRKNYFEPQLNAMEAFY